MGEEAPVHQQAMPLNKAPTMSIDTKAARANSEASTNVPESLTHEETNYPMSPRNFQNPFSRAQTSLDMDDYFVCSLSLAQFHRQPEEGKAKTSFFFANMYVFI